MAYTFRGKLSGLVCADCPEALSNVTVRLYRTRDAQAVTGLAVARPKETFAILTPDDEQAKAGALLAWVTTDADGSFAFTLGEREQYAGEAFEIDVHLPAVPHQKAQSPEPPPMQFSITTLQPRWRQGEAGFSAVWDYCVPQRIWSYIRGVFGAWTICGHLRTCKEPRTPIAGATVRAYDADWWQDEALGTAVTDSAGRFRIDYSTADFHLTPFAPIVNIEWASGPDVYFTVQLGAVAIISETHEDGRRPGRENVGPCMCVELCSDQVQPPPVDGVPHWQRVEDFDIQPFPSASGFSAQGYAGGPANSYVFGGSVTLKGNCPLRNVAAPSNPLEYRFLSGAWTWPGGGEDPGSFPSVPPTAMAPVTQVGTTHAGFVFYINALGYADSARVLVGPADLLPGGWIRLDNKAVTVDMRNGTTAVVNVNTANFLRTFDLFVLNTPGITGIHPPRLAAGLPPAEAGRAVTVAEREPIRRYRLAFEVRDGATLAMVANHTLDAIVFDNTPAVVALDIDEPRGGSVQLRYTVDHPHLRFFGIGISNNGGAVHPGPAMPAESFSAPPPVSNYLFRGGASGGGFAVKVAADPKCAYRVALSWQTRHYQASVHVADRLFCKQA